MGVMASIPLRVPSGLLAALLCVVPTVARAQDASKGAALLAEAQKAVGGADRLAAVKTLHVTGAFRRVIAGNDSDGDFEIFLEAPDKYLRSEKTGTPGQPSTETIAALVGTTMRDVVRGGGGRGGRGGNPGAGRGDGGDIAGTSDGIAGPDGVDAPQAPDGREGQAGQGVGQDAPTGRGRGRGRAGVGADAEALQRARQAEVARLWLMWLLRSDVPVTWIGIAESPDGKADVLEARFAGEATRLFLESASHMPLMMTWQAGPGRAGGRRGDTGPPQPMTLEMTFADHRVVNGIRLPHVITRGMNGQTIEQWTIRSYRVNPSFSTDTFTR